jgi:3-mercaptopyruvate sulfurtransferase SseA
VALQLKRAGIRKVHPLAGGFEAWRKLDLPVEPSTPSPPRLHTQGGLQILL